MKERELKWPRHRRERKKKAKGLSFFKPQKKVPMILCTTALPPKGSLNLTLSDNLLHAIKIDEVGV